MSGLPPSLTETCRIAFILIEAQAYRVGDAALPEIHP
jgi:hypothetical protein